MLIATTLILTAGFAALTLSATPTVVLMGELSCLAILTALAVDLTLLLALLAPDRLHGPADHDDGRAARG